MSQFLDGSFGRLSSHDGGMPVYLRTVLTPDCLAGSEGGFVMVGSAMVDTSTSSKLFGETSETGTDRTDSHFDPDLLFRALDCYKLQNVYYWDCVDRGGA